MKKYIFLSLLFALSVQCSKTEKTAATPETQTTEDILAGGKAYRPEDMANDAKKYPLTNLVLSSSNFDFGKIKKGAQVSHVYEVTNTGKNPLIISSVRPGCGCTAPEYTKEPILPGKKGNITLKFDSQNFDGKVVKQAEVYTNTEHTPITLTFTADIQP